MAGIREGRGEWRYRRLTVTAASNISQGTAVKLAGARTVSEYSGGEANWLGFLKHASINSLPVGQVIVAVPTNGNTFFIDVPTGLAASSLSLGETVGLYKVGGVTSYLTTSYTSTTGRILTIVGPCDSATSRIEVEAILADVTFGSSTSAVIP